MSHRRRAFTLMEVTLVSGLMSLLVLLLSSTWYGACRPALDLIVRGELLQEADMAVASLARDFGGSLANPSGRVGGKKQWQWVGWEPFGSSEIRLCFDGGSEPDGEPDWGVTDHVISYYVQDNNLIRWDGNADTGFTVAKHVSGFQVVSDGDDCFHIVLTFTFRGLTRTCTLHARLP